MNYIWLGSEDVDFPKGQSPIVSTDPASFRTGFARCSVACSGLAYSGSSVFNGGVVTSAWMSFQWAVNSQSNASWRGAGLINSVSGNGSGIWLGGAGAGGGYIGLYLFNGTTLTLLATSPVGPTWLSNTTVRVRADLQIVNYGAESVVNVYINGVLYFSYNGNTTIAGIDGFDSVGVNNFFSNGHYGVSEIVVADSSTLGLQGLGTREITANGTTQQWNNPDIGNFDPVVINDANSTYSNVAGQDEQAAIANSVAGNFAIGAVKIVARANAPAGSAINNLKLGFRNTGGVVAVGAAHALTDAFAPVDDILTIDPTTGQPFTSIDGYQLDLRSA